PGQPGALPGRDRRAGQGDQPPNRDRGRDRQPRPALLGSTARAGRSAAAGAAGAVRLQRPAALSRSRSRPHPPHPPPALQRRHPVALQRRPAPAAHLAAAAEVDHRRRHRVRGPRQGDPRRELPAVAEPPEDPQDRRPAVQVLGRAADLPRQGEPAGQLPALLSTAVDSVTLYGEDPAPSQDIYGKIGNSGVNVPTLDDMKKLYSGFDLCATTTSVSMTINGPAPIILAMFMNTAIDQQEEKYLREDEQRWDAAAAKIDTLLAGRERP